MSERKQRTKDKTLDLQTDSAPTTFYIIIYLRHHRAIPELRGDALKSAGHYFCEASEHAYIRLILADSGKNYAFRLILTFLLPKKQIRAHIRIISRKKCIYSRPMKKVYTKQHLDGVKMAYKH